MVVSVVFVFWGFFCGGVTFPDCWYFFIENSRCLLGLVLGANVGLVGGVAVTGERFLVLETNFFLS